jgi:CDP-glucose 4,6-dehydratase
VVVLADLTDYESLLRILDEHEVRTVFHLAAQAIVSTANRGPLATWESNVRGTYTLLEACRTTGDRVDRIIVASSDKAYGKHDELPYREDFPLRASNPYDVSKACADMIARSYAVTYELPVAVTRLANVYGPGDLNWSRLIPDTARALVRGERPVIRSDGTPLRSSAPNCEVGPGTPAARRRCRCARWWTG